MARHPGAEAVATLVRVVVPVDKRGPGSDVLLISGRSCVNDIRALFQPVRDIGEGQRG
jgi:hypothetical protein